MQVLFRKSVNPSWLLIAFCVLLESRGVSSEMLRAGVATRDITPEESIWLSGYAARTKPSTGVANRLMVKAIVFEDQTKERVALVALDNCEVTEAFTAPALREIGRRHEIRPEAVVIVSSHTHSGPVLESTLPGMFELEGINGQRVHQYSKFLRAEIVAVVGEALEDLSPVSLQHGVGKASFAMNRRIFQNGKVNFGENPEGPVDYDVPVLKVSGADGTVRAVLFGYACHGTTIGGSAGDDFYSINGDYMGYARDYIEEVFPGAHALYMTGCGADINPSPRGKLIYAERHGLELAGAVCGVLTKPMRPVHGGLNMVFRRVQLPLEKSPAREQLEKDAQSSNQYVRNRALLYLKALDEGTPRPESVSYAMNVVRIGNDLTFVTLAGEVVIDYALRLKRELRHEQPWLIGFAYEVPCYIPTKRILLEGGYEADSSLIYYGIYGPFKPQVEDIIVKNVLEMVAEAKGD